MRKLSLLAPAALLAALLAAPARAAFIPSSLLNFDATPEQIADSCHKAQQRAQMALAGVASSAGSPTFSSTAGALDLAVWNLIDETASDTFLKDVAVSSSVRQASLECKTQVDQFLIDVYTREDLFKAVQALDASKPKLAADSRRLVDKQLLDFKRNGLLLPPDKRDEVKKLDKQIVALEEQFDKNIAEDKESLWLSPKELEGLPDDYIARLDHENGKYRVTVDYPDFFPFMENAKNEDARKRLEFLFDNRAAKKNVPLLEQALKLREEAARKLGYKNHAAYVLEDRMAKNPETVDRFIDGLVTRLKPMAKKELKELSALKRADVGPKGDATIHLWDWRYYDNQLRKKRYQVDNDALKAYFPLGTVTAGMFRVYETLLGVHFEQVKDAAVWAPDVTLWKVTDAMGGDPIGYFYMDLFPRDGKYKHAASFDIIHGRLLADGTYQRPVSAIVANFTKPEPGVPSLLKPGEHEEVETFFHEFGHIMHMTLTTARYGRFSGTNVDQDFVEAPSQMLENWVWDPQIISMMSGRYDDPSKKLPEDELQKMVASKLLDSGIVNLRQMLFASVDMAYHTSRDVPDTTKVWARIAKKVALMPIEPGTHPEASFGHIMGGYDAGYYGYMWSKVYAQDMFTRFQQEGLLNPAIGRQYRDDILAPGGSKDPMTLLETFLGRKPNDKAFLRSLGLKVK